MLIMKTTTTSLFLFFIFTITQSSYLFGVTNATNDPVVDVDGELLRTGVEYYVMSWIIGAGGGGLALGRPAGNPCPESVVQRMADVDDGIPVIFSNVDPNDDVVHQSTDVNIEFLPIRPKLCLTSTVWKVDKYNESTGKQWLTTGGVKGNHGPDTASNWFKLEKYNEFTFKFKHCPTVCESCKPVICSDIGKARDTDGQMRLGLSDEAWGWVFIKAQRTSRGKIQQLVNA